MEIKNWADLGALSKEELDAYTPEDLESLKISLADNEAKSADERKTKDEDYAKAKELSENYKIRAEKAEKEAKGNKVEKEENQLTAKDALALINAKVADEDLDEVIRVAKILGKPLTEALKDKTMLTILSSRDEERRTANATLTKGGARGVSKTIGEDLLDLAEKTGEVPETKEDMQKLFLARLQRKAK